MSRYIRPSASVLAVLMAVTSVLASQCDLSCWLQQTESDCHSSASPDSAKNTMDMAMPGMDMSMADMATIDMPGMDMPPQTDNASPNASNASAPKRNATNHSQNPSPCSHGKCDHASASASPPTASHFDASFMLFVGAAALAPARICTLARLTETNSSPPEIIPPGKRSAILRI